MMAAVASAAGWLIGSTAGRILIGVVVFVTWLHFHDAGIRSAAIRQCNADHARAAEEEKQRQADIIFRAGQDADKRAGTEAMTTARLVRELEAINEDLGEARGNSCGVPKPAIRRLRKLG